MWSHYADQHRGLCIGYLVPSGGIDGLGKVAYKGTRWVSASNVAAMLNGEPAAQNEVDEAVLFRKAGSWHYEREWRLIGPQGTRDSPLKMERIMFGMRCEDSTKFAVMKALEQRQKQVAFYEMRAAPGTFNLKPSALNDTHEIFADFPRDYHSIVEMFDDLSMDEVS